MTPGVTGVLLFVGVSHPSGAPINANLSVCTKGKTAEESVL